MIEDRNAIWQSDTFDFVIQEHLNNEGVSLQVRQLYKLITSILFESVKEVKKGKVIS